MFKFVYKTSPSLAVVFMGTLIGLACIAVPHTKNTYPTSHKRSHMICLFVLIVLTSSPVSLAGCPSGNYAVNSPIPSRSPTGSDGEFVFHEFRHAGVGTSTTTTFEITHDIPSAEILIIGGGGGGGGGMHRNRGPGGGGSGRLLWLKDIRISTGSVTVKVGSGGAFGVTGGSGRGGNGIDSVFLGYTAAGGGGGGAATQDYNTWRHGASGGSGGGGGDFAGTSGAASAANSPESFGNRGGASVGSSWDNGGAGAGGGGAGAIGENNNGYAGGSGGLGLDINITGNMTTYAKGGNGGMWNEFPPIPDNTGYGGNAGRQNVAGYVGSSGVVIIRYKIVCNTCPAGLISSESSQQLSDCKLPCPAGQFSSNTASNVARMCGASQNEACPAQMSSITLIDPEKYSASNGNDGKISDASLVHSAENSASAHVFRIDFEKTRNIESVKFFNRVVCCSDRIIGAEIRIGPNATWEENPVCATLSSDSIQTYNCNLVGRYIFIVISAARAQANFPLNFLELQAFSACTSCPATAISLPGSTSSAACGCPAGSFEETRALNPPYASRSYSSLLGDHHSASLLDDAEHIQILTYYSISIQTNVSL